MHKFNNYIYKIIDSDDNFKIVEENEFYTASVRADGYFIDTEINIRIGHQYYLYATYYDKDFNLLEEPIFEENHYKFSYFTQEDYDVRLNIDDISAIIDLEHFFKIRDEVFNESAD